MITSIKRRPWLAASVALPLLGYCGAVGSLAFQQRNMLFETDDDGQLAEAGSLAIPGAQRITVATTDGERIAGWYVAPAPGQPVVLFLHGQGGRLVRQSTRWSKIQEQGFGVLAISYRGYPGSTGRPTQIGLVLDARAAYDWLRTRHAASEIVIQGHSLGSGVAVQLAAAVEARALLLEAPFTAAVDVAAERMPYFPVRLLMLDQFRSRDLIKLVHTPVLIVHGERDSVIPIAHGERLYQLANEPKSLVRMPDSNHNSLSRDGLYDRLAIFLRQKPAK